MEYYLVIKTKALLHTMTLQNMVQGQHRGPQTVHELNVEPPGWTDPGTGKEGEPMGSGSPSGDVLEGHRSDSYTALGAIDAVQ